MDKDDQIHKISILISQIQDANKNRLTNAKEWMLKHTTNENIKVIISKLSVVSFHIMDILKKYNELNGIEIANILGINRGTVTRSAYKMKKLNLIFCVQHIDNKKNIYYQLTQNGQLIAQLHSKMNDELYKKLQLKVSNKFSFEELDNIIKFLICIKNT